MKLSNYAQYFKSTLQWKTYVLTCTLEAVKFGENFKSVKESFSKTMRCIQEWKNKKEYLDDFLLSAIFVY